MFGKHFEAAEATVLFVEIHDNTTTSSWKRYEFILDVRTQTGQTLRTTVREHFVPFSHPKVGDVVKVKYDPKSQKVELDTKGDIRYDTHARELAKKAEREAILSAPAGTPPPQNSSQPGQQAQSAPQVYFMQPDQMAQFAQQFQFAQAAQLDQQAQFALMQHALLQNELLRTGSEGTATILGLTATGLSFSPMVSYLVDAQVTPTSGGFSFACSFTTWVNTGKKAIYPGDSLPVRYDPQNTSRIVFHFT